MSQRLRWRDNALVWLVVSALVIVLDQMTKAIVIAAGALRPHASFPASSTGRSPSTRARLSVSWPIAGLAALAVHGARDRCDDRAGDLAERTPRGDWRTALPLALVIGGALGNLIDRVRAGTSPISSKSTIALACPAFNVADSAISVGATLLILFGCSLQANVRAAS